MRLRYHSAVPKLPPQVLKLVGTRWTANARTGGWRHFEVLAVRRAELRASCDGAVRVSVMARALLEREGWVPGWSKTVPGERE
jgi:tryptophan-rich hypothetical protein